MGLRNWKVGLVFQLVLLLELVSTLKSAKNFIIVSYSFDKLFTLNINESIEYIFEHKGVEDSKASDYPVRITVSSQESSRNFPIFVTARQQKGILSWQLPVVIDNKELPELSRTLCPNRNYFINDDTHDEILNQPTVSIYTSSPKNISFSLSISLVEDFYLESDLDKVIYVSPSTPQVYFYSFKQDVHINNTSSQGVTNGKKTAMRGNVKNENSQTSKNIIIRLDSSDDYCMLVSIQNASCPIFDTENDILFEGFYETVSRRGGLTIPRKRYPLGFYIVLVVKSTDEDCTGTEQNSTVSQFTNFFEFDSQPFDHRNIAPRNDNENRLKNVKIHIKSSISSKEYWIASTSGVLVIVAIYIIFLSGLFCYKYKPIVFEDDEQETVVSSPNSNMVRSANDGDDKSEIQSSINNETAGNSTETTEVVSRSDSHASLRSPELCDKLYLDKLCTSSPQDIKRQSGLYLWHLVTIAIFYGLPVIQLVITYQRVLNNSGNQDLCYYNFLCAHPVGPLSDFNHVFSNLGYILLGGLFMFFTWKKHRQYKNVDQANKNFGIPPHHGLFYAMGVALMMEGVLSASYHVCPNHSNFQFDTSFMYIMAVLCMVKIYQTRHPDINARAHSTFSMLAAAILICLFGVLYPNFYFWLFFTILHITTCLLLTFQIYYMGDWKFNFCCCTSYKCGDVCKPIYRNRCILVLIANLCNWGLAIWGLYNHSKDFATHLLYVFLMNLALHLAFYITMKLANKERPEIYTWVLLGTAIITWGAALFFFFSPNTSWALTPAESRTYNIPCALLKFYDYHDIWHLLSAAAMFFSFMLLLTLDDDIMHKPHSKIPVF